MKSTVKIVLLVSAMMVASPVMANDWTRDRDEDRNGYYNQRAEAGMPRAEATEPGERRMGRHGHGDWREKHRRQIANDIADGADNDSNNRSRHSFIFGRDGASNVVKH